LSNARADGEDRKTRLNEVVEVHAACHAIGGRVGASNNELAKQIAIGE